MSIFELLYGFQGRISRAQWWFGQLALLSLLALFYVFWTGWLATNELTGELLHSVEPGHRLTILAVLLVLSAICSSVLVWMAFSLAIKRVHDQGRSGWRTVAYALPFLFSELMPNSAFTWVALTIAVWYVLELGCFRGYPRHNQYGPAVTPDEDDAADLDQTTIAAAEMAPAAKRETERPAPPSPAAHNAGQTRFGRRADGRRLSLAR
jgi:uncharacterized membrane protein YhaH (DUF805 family)